MPSLTLQPDTTDIVPVNRAFVSICAHCGEWADTQRVEAGNGYDELTGDYCDDCRTTALILLHGEGAPLLTEGDIAALATQLEESRLNEGRRVSSHEVIALTKWLRDVATTWDAIRMVLVGDLMIADFADGVPCFGPIPGAEATDAAA